MNIITTMLKIRIRLSFDLILQNSVFHTHNFSATLLLLRNGFLFN